MRRALSLLIVLAVCAMPMAAAAQAQAGKTLDIYYIDTEGGQATLFVSPTGADAARRRRQLRRARLESHPRGAEARGRETDRPLLADSLSRRSLWKPDRHRQAGADQASLRSRAVDRRGPSEHHQISGGVCGLLQVDSANDRQARRQARVRGHRHHRCDERQRSAEDAHRESSWRRTAEPAVRRAQAARREQSRSRTTITLPAS